MPTKVTAYYLMSSTSRAMGWSENFFNQTNDIGTCNDRFADMGKLLRGIHGYNSIMTNWRISVLNNEMDNTRVSEPFEAENTTANTAVPASLTSDYPTISLLLQAKSIARNQETRQWIKGIGDSVVEEGRFQRGDKDWSTLLNAWLAHMNTTTNGWGMRCLNLDQAIERRISTFNATTGEVTTRENHGFTANSIVQLGKFKRVGDGPSINKMWAISNVTLTGFKLVGWVWDEQTFYSVGIKTYAKNIIHRFSAASWSYIRATSRQVGRPFGSPAGRRRARS